MTTTQIDRDNLVHLARSRSLRGPSSVAHAADAAMVDRGEQIEAAAACPAAAWSATSFMDHRLGPGLGAAVVAAGTRSARRRCRWLRRRLSTASSIVPSIRRRRHRFPPSCSLRSPEQIRLPEHQARPRNYSPDSPSWRSRGPRSGRSDARPGGRRRGPRATIWSASDAARADRWRRSPPSAGCEARETRVIGLIRSSSARWRVALVAIFDAPAGRGDRSGYSRGR